MIGFIGDIHGCKRELDQVLRQAPKDLERLVFLGDYVNRGPESREVIDTLLDLADTYSFATTFLRGNHDTAFLSVINGEPLDTFLQMGGAPTIRSYLGASAPPDVSAAFRASVPATHVAFFRNLDDSYESQDIYASHSAQATHFENRFRIYGHSQSRGDSPFFDRNRAAIDTGCGTARRGRLTMFLYPSRRIIQSARWDEDA